MDGLDRSSGFLECLWNARDIVVHMYVAMWVLDSHPVDPVRECVSEGKFADTTESILDYAHDRLV